MQEEWRPIVGFEGFYEVSSLGRVRSLDRVIVRKNGNPLPCKGKVLKCPPGSHGYPEVNLAGRKYLVHRLVAEAFLPNPETKPEVNHKDGVKTNVTAKNLEWVTPKQNTDHAVDTGLHPYSNGSGYKLSAEDRVAIKEAFSKGTSVIQLAKAYAVTRMTIYNTLKSL